MYDKCMGEEELISCVVEYNLQFIPLTNTLQHCNT